MNDNLLPQLELLGKLKQQGVLTEAEFERQKASLLNNDQPPSAVNIPPAESVPTSTPSTSKKKDNSALIIFGVIGVIFLCTVFSGGDNQSSSTSSSSTDATIDKLTTDSSLASSSAYTPLAEVPPASAWTYSDEDNAMNGKEYFAFNSATELLNFDFPYNGGSEATLTIRKKKGETDLLLRVSKGQFVDHYDEGTVRIKFDNKPTGTYSISRASDGSSDVIFIDSAKKVISRMKASKRMIIEAEFYNEGTRQIEFDTKGLKWNH